MSLRTRLIQKLIGINEDLIFYPALRKFYKSVLKKNTAILDVGSNKGQSIDFFLSIDPASKIVGFEPNKKLYNGLVQKYRNNPAIELHNVGASSQDGKLLFNENVLDETSSFEALNYESAYLDKKAKILGVKKDDIIVSSYEVDIISLNAFLNKKGIRHIDVLKIDVEGHEYKALQGLFTADKLLCYIRFIQIESHNDDMYLETDAEKINELLNQNNFFEKARFKHGFGDFYEIIYENKTSL